MPAYNAQKPIALCPGFAISLVNDAASDSGITITQQLVVAPVPNQTGETVMIANTTDQDATGEFAVTDVAADYQNLSGCVVPSGTALAYNVSGAWLRFTFVSAPTSGSLFVSR